MRRSIRYTAIAAAVVAGLGGGASVAQASNWVLLQGTEPFGKAHTLQVWGFLQPTYRYIEDSDKPNLDGTGAAGAPMNGTRPIFNTLGPDRASNQAFSLFRARMGARGVMHPVDDKINYFFLAEFGTNGITRLDDPGSSSVSPQLTDASVTFRHYAGGGTGDPWNPGVSLRMGQFKMPLADEGSRGIMSFDYINFSEVTRQQVLERYVRANSGSLTGFDGSISAFRDIGVQLFDEIKVSDHWEAVWAAAVGNGNGINRLDNDGNLDVYLRAQTAYVFDGVKRGGPRREDLKFFAWAQMGERRFDDNGDGVYQSSEQDYERNRYGLGFHFYKQPYRFSGEYIWGNGMVFNGVAPPVSDPSTQFQDIGDVTPQMAADKDNEFDGWYVEGAYFPIPNKLGIQARYDVLNRLSATPGSNSPAGERKFETITLGLQYWNHPAKGQWTLNYRIRDLEAPNLPGSHPANRIGSTMGNEIGLQYFLLFKNVALR